MTTRKLAVACAAALVLGVVLGATLVAIQPAPQVVRSSEAPQTSSPTPSATQTPTPTPTQSPIPTPTPTATVQPTPPPRTPTPCPHPTNHTAGDQLLPYYFQARSTFPIFPSAPQIDLDAPFCEPNPEAEFRGLTPLGIPIFTVREGFVMTQRTAYHEIGHAYEELLKRKDASVDVRAKYWAFRGFPGTWQQAQQLANGQWALLPGESWAEAFSIAVLGSGSEKTVDYGRTINPTTTRAFFVSLLSGT
jgi:hypothetical protein